MKKEKYTSEPIFDTTFKKVIGTFYTSKYNLYKFEVLQNIKTKAISIMVFSGNSNEYECGVSDFELKFKINISEIIGCI